jgi:hypothetical protein
MKGDLTFEDALGKAQGLLGDAIGRALTIDSDDERVSWVLEHLTEGDYWFRYDDRYSFDSTVCWDSPEWESEFNWEFGLDEDEADRTDQKETERQRAVNEAISLKSAAIAFPELGIPTGVN